ncbi:hypothetical protein K493DRAFT_306411 [Basidiobolus meristosporus CBS 931.73]|uniref:Uncharacterized protein n=1 Tax=Basidiobolus meristosporus CBS 931.73 TaxID=1314790 RepID=A0A1Y1XSE7_9FUNG|nr:hypothetical protein K493DRAFT_306411 [Basidiobolus meristosporus CBS 931.73]|eukprot:ORX88677.1 hypothetical protein K493DRAFT_306411 [Basidiobolus meristosporus CBS 931.73]
MVELILSISLLSIIVQLQQTILLGSAMVTMFVECKKVAATSKQNVHQHLNMTTSLKRMVMMRNIWIRVRSKEWLKPSVSEGQESQLMDDAQCGDNCVVEDEQYKPLEETQYQYYEDAEVSKV